MFDVKLAIGNEHNPDCDEDAVANICMRILSYHDKEIEIGIYVYCSECDKFLGKTTATVMLEKEEREKTALDKIREGS